MVRQIEGAPECVRCRRSEADHLRWDRDDFDDIQRRIWKALGWPCAEFVDTPAQIYAGNQAAVSRWASRRRAGQPSPAASGSADPGIARRNAAAAREALGLTRHDDPEGS